MIKSGYNNTSKSKSWNVLETVMSHLKRPGVSSVSTNMAADQGQFSGSFLQTNFQGYCECSACHVLAPDLENLLQHKCAICKSGR